ncbi:hypothetical protein C8R47DRAFT_1078528 [Mycena vitilis]|nr:hypothetical protein C8R47DRAFT_1078528 [Mycena vitilis]
MASTPSPATIAARLQASREYRWKNEEKLRDKARIRMAKRRQAVKDTGFVSDEAAARIQAAHAAYRAKFSQSTYMSIHTTNWTLFSEKENYWHSNNGSDAKSNSPSTGGMLADFLSQHIHRKVWGGSAQGESGKGGGQGGRGVGCEDSGCLRRVTEGKRGGLRTSSAEDYKNGKLGRKMRHVSAPPSLPAPTFGPGVRPWSGRKSHRISLKKRRSPATPLAPILAVEDPVEDTQLDAWPPTIWARAVSLDFDVGAPRIKEQERWD